MTLSFQQPGLGVGLPIYSLGYTMYHRLGTIIVSDYRYAARLRPDLKPKPMQEHVVRREPHERIVGLSESCYADHPLIINLPKYWCGECDEITPFALRCKNPPGFNQTHRRLFDDAMRPGKPYGEDFCEFNCRLCGRSVRVVYREVEFHAASYVHVPVDVLEIEARPGGAGTAGCPTISTRKGDPR